MKLKVKDFRPGYPLSFSNTVKTFVATNDPDLRGCALEWDTETNLLSITTKEGDVIFIPWTNVAQFRLAEPIIEQTIENGSRSPGRPRKIPSPTAA
jgi:hypothetical protein